MTDKKTSQVDQSELMARVMQKMIQADSKEGLPVVENNFMLHKENGLSIMSNSQGNPFYVRYSDKELRVATGQTYAVFNCGDGKESIGVGRVSGKYVNEQANTPEEIKALVKEWGITEEDLALQVRQYTNEALQSLMKHGDLDLRSGSMCNKQPFENQLILEATQNEIELQKDIPMSEDKVVKGKDGIS